MVTPQERQLADALVRRGAVVDPAGEHRLEVHGMTSADVGEAAAAADVVLHELCPVHTSLEEAFLTLTREEVEYRSDRTAGTATEGAAR